MTSPIPPVFPAKVLQGFLFSVLLLSPLSLPGWVSGEQVEIWRSAVVEVRFEDSFGTGFFVDRDGLILTNAHVISDTEAPITIVTVDGRELSARFLSFSPAGLDLAALRIETVRGRRGRETWPYLEIAPPGGLKLGEMLFSFSNAYPLYPGLFSNGVVSHTRPSHNAIVHTVTTVSGSSGGPLLNLSGQVVGIGTESLLDSTDGYYSEFRGGFNVGLDAAALRDFLKAIEQGVRETIRVGHLTFLRMPLPLIKPGQTLTGELTRDSDRLQGDLSFCQGYWVDLEEGMTYRIRLLSNEFDAYLLLYDNFPVLIDENDDANANTTDAEILISAPSAGRFTVVATSFSPGETGSYQIRMEALTFDEQETQSHLLDSATSLQSDEGFYFQDFLIPGRPGYDISILMESEEVDSYLELYDAEGNLVAWNDDWSAHTLNARIIYGFDSDETYRIRARSFGAEETGSFLLTIGYLRRD